MAYPNLYAVAYSYTNFQLGQGDNSFPGTQVDADLAGLSDSIANLSGFMKTVIRSDGKLTNGIVTYDSLAAELQTAGLAPANAWLTATFYAVNAAVIVAAGMYRCAVAHTSGVFATDLAAGKWTFVVAIPVGPTGIGGPTGADGATVLNGSGAPGAGLGANGDFYIDTAATAIYGPKAAGAWGAGTSLIGSGTFVGPAASTDNAIIRYDGTTGKLGQNSVVTVGDTGKVFVPDDNSVSTPMHQVGTGGTQNSIRPAYAVMRSLTGAEISLHAFADNTTFDVSGPSGANSFDSRTNHIGTQTYDHFNSFQSILNYASTGTMNSHTGYTWTPTASKGKVLAMYGMLQQNPVITGTAVAPDYVYGVFVSTMTAGTFNRAIFTQGATVSEFGGKVLTYGEVQVNSATPTLRLADAGGSNLGAVYGDGAGNIGVKNYASNSIFLNFNGTNYLEAKTDRWRPVADNVINLGDSTHRWSVVFAGTGTINTSDARQKTELQEAPQEFYDAMLSVDLGTFQWLDAVEKKGGSARIHYGTTAQRVQEALRKFGLDPNRYAMFCEDPETKPVTKTRTREQQKIEEREIDFPVVRVIDGKAVQTTEKRIEMHPVTVRMQVFTSDGTPVVDAWHDEPVMETITEEYVEDEPTGKTVLGLRMDQFIFARCEALGRKLTKA